MSKPYGLVHIGKIVHYRSHGTPLREDGTQEYRPRCRAAIVTDVPEEPGLDLCVLNPEGMFFNRGVMWDPAGDGGTWHNIEDHDANSRNWSRIPQ